MTPSPSGSCTGSPSRKNLIPWLSLINADAVNTSCAEASNSLLPFNLKKCLVEVNRNCVIAQKAYIDYSCSGGIAELKPASASDSAGPLSRLVNGSSRKTGAGNWRRTSTKTSSLKIKQDEKSCSPKGQIRSFPWRQGGTRLWEQKRCRFSVGSETAVRHCG